jgi:hypothetical protein
MRAERDIASHPSARKTGRCCRRWFSGRTAVPGQRAPTPKVRFALDSLLQRRESDANLTSSPYPDPKRTNRHRSLHGCMISLQEAGSIPCASSRDQGSIEGRPNTPPRRKGGPRVDHCILYAPPLPRVAGPVSRVRRASLVPRPLHPIRNRRCPGSFSDGARRQLRPTTMARTAWYSGERMAECGGRSVIALPASASPIAIS